MLFQLKLDMTSSRRQEVVREKEKTGQPTTSKALLKQDEIKAKEAKLVDSVDRDGLSLLRELNELRGQSFEPDAEARLQKKKDLRQNQTTPTAGSLRRTIAA